MKDVCCPLARRLLNRNMNDICSVCGYTGHDDRLSGDHCDGWLPGHLHLKVGSEVSTLPQIDINVSMGARCQKMDMLLT